MDSKDPNTTSQTPPVEATAFQPTMADPSPNVVQQADPMPSIASDPPPGKNGKLIWMVAGLIILILILGGVYFYLTQYRTTTEPSPTPKPAASQQGSMEDELNTLDVEAEGNDFQEVDKDLQSL